MIKWREYLIKQLAADRQEALGYLQAAIELYRRDGDAYAFLSALRTFIASQQGDADAQCNAHHDGDL